MGRARCEGSSRGGKVRATRSGARCARDQARRAARGARRDVYSERALSGTPLSLAGARTSALPPGTWIRRHDLAASVAASPPRGLPPSAGRCSASAWRWCRHRRLKFAGVGVGVQRRVVGRCRRARDGGRGGRWLSGAGIDADSGRDGGARPTPRAARELCEVVRAARRLAQWLPQRAACWRAGSSPCRARCRALACLAPAASTPRRPPRSAAAAAGRRQARQAAAHVALGYCDSAAGGGAAACAAPLGCSAPAARRRRRRRRRAAALLSRRRRELVVGRARRRGAARVGRAPARVIVEAGDDAPSPTPSAARPQPSRPRPGRFRRPQRPAAARRRRAAGGRRGRLPRRGRWRAAAGGAGRGRARGRTRAPGGSSWAGEVLLTAPARQAGAADGTDVAGAAGARLRAACAPAAGGLDQGVAALRRPRRRRLHRRLSSTVRVPAQLSRASATAEEHGPAGGRWSSGAAVGARRRVATAASSGSATARWARRPRSSTLC